MNGRGINPENRVLSIPLPIIPLPSLLLIMPEAIAQRKFSCPAYGGEAIQEHMARPIVASCMVALRVETNFQR